MVLTEDARMRGPSPDLASANAWSLRHLWAGSPQAYIVAVLCVGVAVLARWTLGFAGDELAPFPICLAAAVLASLLGGLGPGLAAALLVVLADWFMRSGRFVPFGAGEIINFTAWLAAAGLSAWAAGRYRQLSERCRSQDDLQAIVIDELRHRLKNKTSTIQAIIGLHLRDNPARCDQIFKALAAVNAADNLVTAGGGKAAGLADILREELAPYEPSRVAITGPDVRLPSRLATTMALVLHELTTNAAKYGALSTCRGRLAIAWSVTARQLKFTWREADGPEVVPPVRRGFGTRLFSRALAPFGGRLATAFAPTGFYCEIDLPL
jgi:two-component sensor histidine kinase